MKLPVFKIRRAVVVINDAKARRVWEVTCPWKDCGEIFYVRLQWRKTRSEEHPDGTTTNYRRRACPFCFRASEVP